ncbi:MAG: hypothetical protein IPK79_08945 [Vampirovibrionales bacterium]|nr:hypothetical protein [Vampirovibrionales bacterium]
MHQVSDRFGTRLGGLCRSLIGFPGLSGVFFMLAFLFALWAPALTRLNINILNDSDTCWLIKTGEWILSHGALPATNPFSAGIASLAAVPIVCYQWLFEVALALAFRAAGLHGVVLLIAAIFGLTFVILVRWLYRKGFASVPDIVLSGAFALAGLAPFAIARPMSWSLILTALLMALFSRDHGGSRAPWRRRWIFLPLLFLVWANTHLGFLPGLAILAVYCAAQAIAVRQWQPMALWALCALATLVNPYGATLYSYFAQLADSPYMNQSIMELKSPAFHLEPSRLALYVTPVIAAVFRGGDPRLRAADRVLLALTFPLALLSLRHYYLFALAGLPFVASAVSGVAGAIRQAWARRTPAGANGPALFSGFSLENDKPALFIALILAMGLILANVRAFPASFPFSAAFAGAFAYLRDHPPPGLVISRPHVGSYLLWSNLKTRGILDSRMDMYGDRWSAASQNAFWFLPGWESYARRHGVVAWVFTREDLSGAQCEFPAKPLRVAYHDKSMCVVLLQPRAKDQSP